MRTKVEGGKIAPNFRSSITFLVRKWAGQDFWWATIYWNGGPIDGGACLDTQKCESAKAAIAVAKDYAAKLGIKLPKPKVDKE